MSNVRHLQNKPYWLWSVSVIFIILVSIIISIIQIRHRDTILSKAQSPVTSPTPNSTISSVPTATPWPPTSIPQTSVPGFVAKPDDTQVYANIKIIGIGIDGNAQPKHLSRYVQVEIFDLTNKSVARGNGNLTYDNHDLFSGIIHLGKIDNGKYYIKIAGNNTLVRLVKPQFQELNNTNLNILSSVTLIQGDINANNIMDINDYNSMLPCFQNTKCQYKELIDFNDDDITNAIDYNILLSNFWGAQGD